MPKRMFLPSDLKRGRPNCGVVAVAVFCGTTYQVAEDTIRQHSKRRGNWKGRTYHHEQVAALRKLNKGRSAAFRIRSRQTLQGWMFRHAMDDTLYMVRTTGHMQCVYNGMVADQSGVWPISEYWGRRKVVHWAVAKK